MKKSLSLILAIAMVFSMFASVAFAADASLDTKAKYDALNKAGIFEGTDGGDAALDQPLTRAQFAKVITKVLNLPEDAASASIFNDLTGAGWAAGFIGAAVKAGLVDGVAPGKFDPSANVTTEQLAKLLVLGLKLQTSTDAVSGTVADWAKGYVAAAIKNNLIAATSDYTKPALRSALVEATYAAQAYLANQQKLSITEAKAAGVYKVEVKFNKAVDAKAEFALKKGAQAVSISKDGVKWSDDKKVATLTLDTRITAGEYNVTVSGLDLDKATASFTAEDEQVSKIDFVNANDTVAYSANATFKVKASNQYGEAVSIGTSSFTALISGQAPTGSFKKDSDGNFVITTNISGLAGITQGNGVVPVTVYYNNSNVSISKNFKVGTVPILSKIETDKVTYSNNGKSLLEKDETASVFLKLYDQYGNPVVKAQFNGATPEILAANINPQITPYEQKLAVVKVGATFAVGDLFDENDKARVKVKLTDKLDKTADYTLNIYGGSSSATATISVGAANLATKIEFDTSALVVAANDRDVYVPLIATDANGTKLSAQEIVDNQVNNDRFLFQVAGGTATIQQTGEHKGKVHLAFTADNTVGTKLFVSGQIKNSLTSTFTQTTLNVDDFRVPDKIEVTTEPAAKAILGADDEIEFQLKDKTGKDISSVIANVPSANGQVSNYRVVVKVTTEGTGTTATPKSAPVTPASVSGSTTTYTFLNTELALFNAGFDINTNGSEGKVTVKAVVERAPNGTSNYSDYSNAVSRTLEAVKSDIKLTYSLETIGDLYAAKDKLSAASFTGENLTAADSKFDKKIKVVAKDSGGNKVKLPSNYIDEIAPSDNNVINVATYTTGGVKDAYVIGNKAGTATVTAIVYTNKGNTEYLRQDVTVKADPIVVNKIEAGEDAADFDAAKTFAYQYFTKDADNQLIVTDQYGIEYENAEIAQYDAVLGVRYTVSVTNGSGLVTIDAKTGAISAVPTSVLEFEITAVAPNGKSVSVVVSRP